MSWTAARTSIEESKIKIKRIQMVAQDPITMTDEKKKGFITEDDIVLLIQRYSPSTIITLLQEVYQLADAKIDWKTIVKKTSTGISNPREYQLLWRHLAYRDPLLEEIDGDEPMDDDSDLEFELESDPPVSAEVKSQAVACLKKFDPSVFTLFIRRCNYILCARRDLKPPSHAIECGRESTGLPNERVEGNETPGSANKKRRDTSEGNETVGVGSTAKKKRKLWTEEEEADLIAAVKKHGEGNWANILKGDFKHDRTASQISQRWSFLKKKLANSNTGLAKNSISLAKSEALDATRAALNSALKMPKARSSSSINLGAAQPTTPSNISTLPSTKVSESLCRPNSPQASNIQLEASNLPQEPAKKTQTTPKVPPVSMKTSTAASSLIKAAAVAAGGRMAAPSDAISLFRAAQSKNVVHIRAGGSKLGSSISGELRQGLGCFTVPPPNRSSLIISNGNTFVRQVSNSAANGEKTSGKEASVSDGDGSNKCRQ